MSLDLSKLAELQKEMQGGMKPRVPSFPSMGEVPTPVSQSQSLLLSYLQKASEAAASNVASEVNRICDLEIEDDPTEEMIQKASFHYCPEGTWTLKKEQVKALIQFHKYRGGFIPLRVGGGKCSLKDTEILDLNKGRRRVDEIGFLTTPSLSREGKIVSAKATAFPSGEKPCVRLKLKGGQSIGLSLDHPVLTQKGWIEAGNLTVSDMIATPSKLLDPEIPLKILDSEVRLSAYLAADGGTSQNSIRFTNPEEIIINEFKEDVKELGGQITEQKQRSKAREFLVCGMMKYRGKLFNKELSKNKRIPANFYLLNKRQTALYLNRFWACDGHIQKTGHKLELVLASEGLIRDIRYMLLRLGIYSRVHYKKATNTHKGIRKYFDAWRLTVSGRDNIKRFFDTVGYPLTHEIRCQQLWNRIKDKKANTNTDIVPVGAPEFKEMMEELGDQVKDRRTILRNKYGVSSGQLLSRDAFKSLVSETKYTGKHAWFASSDIVWERIDQIIDIGVHPVYDLNVPETHNFIGNGIIVHNTLVVCLIASDAYSEFGMDKIVVHCPPTLVGQLQNKELPKYRKHISINCPWIFLSNFNQEQRMQKAKAGTKGVYVVPYSLLQSKFGAELIEAIQPKLIIGDEIHQVASARTTARTRRFREAVTKYEPELVGLSGTVTKKRILDYHFLAVHSLKERCFLPRTHVQAEAWGKMIDSDAEGQPIEPGGGPIEPLITWAKEHTEEQLGNNVVGFRKAYKIRMETCPGVVASTGKDDIGTSIRITNRKLNAHENQKLPGWLQLQDHIKTVQTEWITPDGDEIDHAIHIWKWMYELESFGFYNSLYWPELETIQKRKGVDAATAFAISEESKWHHELGQEYHRRLRKWLQYNACAGLDTPMLVGNNMKNHGDKEVGGDLYGAWNEWRDSDTGRIIERDSRVIRVCPFRLYEVVAWAKEHMTKHPNEGAIIWYKHHGVGKWLVEAFREAGLPFIECPAGKLGAERLEDENNRPFFALTAIGTGNAGHFQGHNCQHWGWQYFAQFPREAYIAEQAMGRNHRTGQWRDEVQVFTCISSSFDNVLFSACLNDAAYIHQSMQPQKLIYADYDTTPKILPYAVLKEWGSQPGRRTKQMEELLKETFEMDDGTQVVMR